MVDTPVAVPSVAVMRPSASVGRAVTVNVLPSLLLTVDKSDPVDVIKSVTVREPAVIDDTVNNAPLTLVSPLKLESADPNVRSVNKCVPAAVPSEVHNSRPVEPSLVVK